MEIEDIFIITPDTSENYITINLGKIESDIKYINCRFKYAGDDEVAVISRSFTNDPHYICNYPKGIIYKDSVYQFRICMSPRIGIINKNMGFLFHENERVIFKLKGEYISRNDDE